MNINMDKKKILLPVFLGMFVLIVLILFIGIGTKYDQSIYISEICAHNSTLVHDPVGRYSDYVVISNDSDQNINLEGYGISTHRKDLRAYVFPSVDVPAHGSLMVWAEAEDDITRKYTDDSVIYIGDCLGDNETVYLTNNNYRECDTVFVPVTMRDEVYVRSKDRSQWSVVPKKEKYLYKGTEVPRFSADSGFYDSPFEVTIEAKEGEIFYTLYGEDPYENGIPYQGPISVIDISGEENKYASIDNITLEDTYIPKEKVDKATVIRSIIKYPDGTFSHEAIATYFVGEDMRKRYNDGYLLSIVANPKDLFSNQTGIYVLGDMWDYSREVAYSSEDFSIYDALTNYNMRGAGWRRDAGLILLNDSGEVIYERNGLIGIHGNWSRSTNQKSFNLMSKDEQILFDGLFENSGRNFVIRTGGTDDARLTNFRDELVNTASKNLAIAPQRSLECQVFLNGEYWGCYSLQDRLDESYIAGRYSVDEDNVILVKNYVPVSGAKDDITTYTKMIEFVDSSDFSKDRDYNRFCDMFDLDSVIDYYCAEIYFGNADAFTNNIAFWRVRETGSNKYEDGKWRFALCDMDSSLGLFEWGADSDTFIEGHWNVNPIDERFFGKLINNQEFREQFCKRFTELAAKEFSYDNLEPIIDEFEQNYFEPMILCNRRYLDPQYSPEQYIENTEVVREFFRKRSDYICDYMNQHLEN